MINYLQRRGQVLPVNLLTNTVNVDLINDHIKYKLQVGKPQAFRSTFSVYQ